MTAKKKPASGWHHFTIPAVKAKRKPKHKPKRKPKRKPRTPVQKAKRKLSQLKTDEDFGRPNPDYMGELAEQFDIDISDLYDMYYGYYED